VPAIPLSQPHTLPGEHRPTRTLEELQASPRGRVEDPTGQEGPLIKLLVEVPTNNKLCEMAQCFEICIR